MLQLLSVVLQYNHMIETLAKRVGEDINKFWSSQGLSDLSRHLEVMAQLLEKAEQEIAPIHDTCPTE